MKEKNMIIKKIVALLLLPLPLLIFAIHLTKQSIELGDNYLIFLCILMCIIVIFLFFIIIWGASCMSYDYQGVKIILYCGAYHHYLKINDEIVDQFNTGASFARITLSGQLGDISVECEIPYLGSETVKVNGKIIQGKRIA